MTRQLLDEYADVKLEDSKMDGSMMLKRAVESRSHDNAYIMSHVTCVAAQTRPRPAKPNQPIWEGTTCQRGKPRLTFCSVPFLLLSTKSSLPLHPFPPRSHSSCCINDFLLFLLFSILFSYTYSSLSSCRPGLSVFLWVY